MWRLKIFISRLKCWMSERRQYIFKSPKRKHFRGSSLFLVMFTKCSRRKRKTKSNNTKQKYFIMTIDEKFSVKINSCKYTQQTIIMCTYTYYILMIFKIFKNEVDEKKILNKNYTSPSLKCAAAYNIRVHNINHNNNIHINTLHAHAHYTYYIHTRAWQFWFV